MNLADLMSGIGVVIDDAFENAAANSEDNSGDTDPIFRIVEQIEREWSLPFYTASSMPSDGTWSGLLQAASFILLDWRLWPGGASHLERAGIEKNVQFLHAAKDYFVPVFIFTNESPDDVASTLPAAIYQEESPEKSFVFIRNKASLLSGGALDFGDIERWVRNNASVYALKTWDRVFRDARKELFGAMYARSPDWPRVFWKAYEDDGVDPSWSLTHLISDSLRGRMRTSAFEAEILAGRSAEASPDDLRALIGENSFRPQKTLPEEEIGCGDVFRLPKGKFLLNLRPDCDLHNAGESDDIDEEFLLNLRPDCDCVPRDGQNAGDVELYCIEGKKIRDTELRQQYQEGHFSERIWESVAFAVHEGRSIRFDFRKLQVRKFSELKDQRIGRLLHPYLTRIQQRFGLYLQRQGLPRIPKEAIPAERSQAPETEP